MFESKEFFYVQAEIEKNDIKLTLNWDWPNMFDKYICYALYEEIV